MKPLGDIDAVYKIYRGDAGGVKSTDMTDEEKKRVNLVRERFVYMSQSKSTLDAKFTLEKQFYEVFEAHLTTGEVWNAPYRFAEMFGTIQRKATELLDTMPEAKLHATKSKTKDLAIALQACVDHNTNMTFVAREKMRVIYDSLFYGVGALFEGYAKVMKDIVPVESDDLHVPLGQTVPMALYDGLTSERVDIRDMFIDETCSVFYDETGIQGARDCIRRRSYPYSTFLERYSNADYKHIDNIIPISWGSDPFGRGKIPYEKETREQKTVSKYVIVLEYWNVELDLVMLVANGIEIYSGANPFKHKRLPFVLYYNYRRDDSVWGVSEIELNAPYVLAEEELINLMILDAKLSLQPALAVSGDIQFNTEETELEPGAIFTLRGLNGGKVSDAIMPLKFGGIPQDAMNVRQILEDKRTVATGDDIRALYANPNQLATQTLSKRETAQKRIKSNVMQNTMEAERNRVQMMLSNIVQFYAKPYQNITGKVVFRRIPVEGYSIQQSHDEAKPIFTQKYGANGYFTLNEEITSEGTEDLEIEIVDAQLDELLKKDQVDDMLKFLNTIVQVLPLSPGLSQSMNVPGLIQQIAKKLDVDYEELFPTPNTEEGEDVIDLELDLVMMGITPDLDPNTDSLKALNRYMEFMNTDTYKSADKKVQKALQDLIKSTSQNVPVFTQQKLAALRRSQALANSGQGAMAAPGQPPQQGGGAGLPPIPGGNVPNAGSQNDQPQAAPVPAPGGVAARLGFGGNKPA